VDLRRCQDLGQRRRQQSLWHKRHRRAALA
jgi:hypothetical protein